MKEQRPCHSAMWGRSILAPCALLLSASVALGQIKLSKDLEGARSSDQVNVIIQFKTAPNAELHKKMLRRGGKFNRELDLVKSGVYSIPASALAELASDPEVAYISLDRPLKSTGTATLVSTISTATATQIASTLPFAARLASPAITPARIARNRPRR